MAQFIFLNKLSKEALTWLKALPPTVNDDPLSESALEQKIQIFLFNLKTARLKNESPAQDQDKHFKYILELASLSWRIAQEVSSEFDLMKKSNDENAFENALLDNTLNQAKTSEVVLAERNVQPLELAAQKQDKATIAQTAPSLFDREESPLQLAQKELTSAQQFVTAKHQAAIAMLKTIPIDPLSTLSIYWNRFVSFFSFFTDSITPAQLIINEKIDTVIDDEGDSLDALQHHRMTVETLFEHAKYHTGILDALISRETSSKLFRFGDIKEKSLDAQQWFALLLVHKDNPQYRKKICEILLKPRKAFSFSEKKSFAYKELKKHLTAIEEGARGLPGLLDKVFQEKREKVQDKVKIQQLVQQQQSNQAEIQRLNKQLKLAQKAKKSQSKNYFSNTNQDTPDGVKYKKIENDDDDNNHDDGDDYEPEGNKDISRVAAYIEKVSDHGDEDDGLNLPSEEEIITRDGKFGEKIVFPRKYNVTEATKGEYPERYDQAHVKALFNSITSFINAKTANESQASSSDDNTLVKATAPKALDAWKLHVNSTTAASSNSNAQGDFVENVVLKPVRK